MIRYINVFSQYDMIRKHQPGSEVFHTDTIWYDTTRHDTDTMRYKALRYVNIFTLLLQPGKTSSINFSQDPRYIIKTWWDLIRYKPLRYDMTTWYVNISDKLQLQSKVFHKEMIGYYNNTCNTFNKLQQWCKVFHTDMIRYDIIQHDTIPYDTIREHLQPGKISSTNTGFFFP